MVKTKNDFPVIKKNNSKKKFSRYVFIVSDATGKLCQNVVNAALTQFSSTDVMLKVFSDVLSFEDIEKIIAKAVKVNGVVVYTFVSSGFRDKITELGRENSVPTVDIMGPILSRLSEYLEISPMAKPGLFKQLDADYFKRIEALDFTIKHDDGLNVSTLESAEIVLVGVSRTTKTPVSVYLSYRGWKVANIPVISGFSLPEELFKVDQRKIVALTIDPARLKLIRMERRQKLKNIEMSNYVDLDRVREEVIYGMRVYKNKNWPVVDVTNRAIEETATTVTRIIHSVFNKKNGHIS
jgi:regulator of PEP synthase PpsR (kinase-PPPase family)